MTENELIERIKHGNRDAFTELMERYQTQVFNIAYSMLSDYEDASDATQEVFIKIYKSITSFKGQSAFTTWVYAICRNVCNDILRKRKKHSMNISLYGDDEDEGAPIRNMKSDTPTPEETVEADERQKLVRDAIASLKPEYCEIIVYSDMQQLSYEEIAAILKCPVGTVRSRLNRARTALRKILAEKRELFL